MMLSHNLGKNSSVSPYAISVINPESCIKSTNTAHKVSLYANISPSNINLESHKYKYSEIYYPSFTHEDASHQVLGHPQYSDSNAHQLCHSTSCSHPKHPHCDTLSSNVASSNDIKFHLEQLCHTSPPRKLQSTAVTTDNKNALSSPPSQSPRRNSSSASLLSYFTSVKKMLATVKCGIIGVTSAALTSRTPWSDRLLQMS